MEPNESKTNTIPLEEKTEKSNGQAENEGKIRLAPKRGEGDADTYEYDPAFKFNYGPLDAFCVVFSLVTYTFDQVTDILLAVYFFNKAKYWYFALTLTFVVVPAFTMTVFSLTWYVQDYKQGRLPSASRIQWFLRVICLLIHFGPILRFKFC